jgi:ABC-type transport system substrate-binding protein
MAGTPSPKDLVWPVSSGAIDVSWDPDSSRLGGQVRSAPYHSIHIPYEPLVTPRIAIDAEGVRYPVAHDLQPRLAERWEAADGFRTWTVWLKKGIKSHAGNELNAESVHWSWVRVYSLARVGLWRSQHLAGLRSADDIEALDDYSLRFRLEAPNPEFPAYWSFATNNIFDAGEAKKHVTESDPWAADWLSANIAGFGAFALDRSDDSALYFRARDEYWAGRPGVNTLTQVGVSNREEAFRMIERGDANIVIGLYPEDYARFAGNKDLTVHRVQANHSTLEFNWLAAPFDDQYVRQAVCTAIPYRRIMDEVYRGYGRISKTPIPSVSKFSSNEFWHYDTDPAKAKELLGKSAYASGFETQLYIQPSGESLRFGEIFRQALKPIGIDVEVRLQTNLPFGQKVPMWFREECGHALYEAMYDLGHDYDPPPNMWSNKNIVDPMWTGKMRAIRLADADTQPEMYRQIQKDIVEFAPCAHIAEIETGWVTRGELDPWALSPLSLGINTTVWSSHRQTIGWF